MVSQISVAELQEITQDHDARLDMEWDEYVELTNVPPELDGTLCSGPNCARPGPYAVIKRHWDRQPLGHLLTHCLDHVK